MAYHCATLIQLLVFYDRHNHNIAPVPSVAVLQVLYDKFGPIQNLRVLKISRIISLRTTMPLVSYIRNSLTFWYHASLSTCCQNLEKRIGVTGKIWEKAGVKLLRDLTEKSVNFSTLATSNIRLLLVFGEEDQ